MSKNKDNKATKELTVNEKMHLEAEKAEKAKQAKADKAKAKQAKIVKVAKVKKLTDKQLNANQLKDSITTIKTFIDYCKMYSIDMAIEKMVSSLNVAVSDEILLQVHVKSVQTLIGLNKDNKTTKDKLVKLAKQLTSVKKAITAFRKKATNAKKLLEIATIQDGANILKSKMFFGWSVQVKKMFKTYELIGFSKNCKVYLLNVGDNEQLKIMLEPLACKDYTQEMHFKKLCNENSATVKKAVNAWLGGVTKPFEMDNIITVQRQMKLQKTDELNDKKGRELYNRLMK